MTSFIKKSIQLGKAAYVTANEIISEQANKPQHSQGGYNQQQSGAHAQHGAQQTGGGFQQGGSYGQVQIPAQHTSSGQGQSDAQIPPALPPRSQEHTSNPQGYGQQHQGHAPAQANAPHQHNYDPTQDYVAGNLQGDPIQAHNQSAYGVSAVSQYNQNAQSQRYRPQGGASSPGAHGLGPIGSQVTGTIPFHPSPQSSWNHSASLPTPPVYQSQPLSAWEQAGSTPPVSSYSQTSNWVPMSSPPQTVSPLNSQGLYTPPTPMNAPLQPFPQQYNPHAPSPIFQPQQHPAQSSSHYMPTPPMSPPLPSLPTSQPHNQMPQYAPVSPPVHSKIPYNSQPYFPQRHGSLPSPISQYPSHNASPIHRYPPQPHTQSPASPSAGYASQMPHPPAFVSELSAYSEPKNEERPPPQLKPKSSFVVAPIPDGYAELPADLYSESSAKPSTNKTSPNLSPNATSPITAASTSMSQTKPLQPPPRPQVAASPPVAYASQQYDSTQPAHTSPAQLNYQPYHPTEPQRHTQHSPPQLQHAGPPSNENQGGYKPYHASPTQSDQQYQAMPSHQLPTQQTYTPQRMSSLASKFSSVNLNGSQPPQAPTNGPPQYLPYPS